MNYKERYLAIKNEIKEEIKEKLCANSVDLKVDLYYMDVDDGVIAVEGKIFYDRFVVYAMIALDDKKYEVEGWSFESDYSGNDAAYFYNLVHLLEGKKPERMQSWYEGFFKVEKLENI